VPREANMRALGFIAAVNPVDLSSTKLEKWERRIKRNDK